MANDIILRLGERLLSGLPDGFIRNLRWQYFGNLGAGVLGGGYFLALGRFLGVADFGLYSLCIAIATIVFACADMRLHEAAILFVSRALADDDRLEATAVLKSLFLIDLLLRLAATLAVISLTPLVIRYVIKVDISPSLIWLAAIALLVAKLGNLPSIGLLRLTDRFDLHAWISVSDWAVRLAITTAVAMAGWLSITTALVIAIGVGLLVNIVTITIAMRTWIKLHGWPRAPLLAGSRGRWRKMHSFLLPSYGISVLDAAVRDLDTAVVGLVLNVEAVGIYRMTKNFAQILWRACDPLFVVTTPIIARYHNDRDHEGMWRFIRKLSLILLAVAVAIFGAATLIAPPLIDLVVPQFSASGQLLPSMTWWILIALPLIWTHSLAAARSAMHRQLWANIIGNFAAVGLLLTLTPRFGVLGASLAWSAGLAFTFIAAFLLIRRRL